MAIEYSIDVRGDFLDVKAWGIDDDVEDVKKYGQALLMAALEHGCSRALCDERELTYTITTIDIYESASFMAEIAPGLSKVAIVFNPDFTADAKFWEDVAVNRGLQVSFFKDIEKAKKWLGIDIAEELPA